MTKEEHEMLDALMNSIYTDITSDIAADRNLSIEKVQQLFDEVGTVPHVFNGGV